MLVHMNVRRPEFMLFFCFYGYGDHRDLHVLTHSFPTRRSSDLDQRDVLLGEREVEEREVLPLPLRRRRLLLEHDLDIEADENKDRKSTSELQSLMRISYAVFCLKKKKT